MVKPQGLWNGATLGVISPASQANPMRVQAGLDGLERLGYRTKLFPHALDRGLLNYAGTIEARVADLHAAYADPEVDAVLCTRGGWGCAELLPHLDKALIAANNKPLVGYSDVTALHIWLQRELGRVSFQGPMVSSDWSKQTLPNLLSWRCALEGSAGWYLCGEQGLRILRQGTGVAEGVLSGGCMSIFVEGLGTPFGPVPQGGVLFLEDIGTAAYQWARMLTHAQQAGLLDGVQGIVFGDMTESVKPEEMAQLEEWLLYALRDFTGPIAIGLRSGHVDGDNVTLPFGVRVRLECEPEGNPRLHFLESAVTV